MSPEENKAIVRRYQDILNAMRLDELGEVVADDVRTPEMLPGFPPGLEGAKEIARVTRQSWPDFHVTLEDLVAEGDRVAARLTITGTAEKELLGIPGTGKSFEVTGMYIARIANGKILEHIGVEDSLGILQQIGVLPAPG